MKIDSRWFMPIIILYRLRLGRSWFEASPGKNIHKALNSVVGLSSQATWEAEIGRIQLLVS
jgi:hypothetical protein